MERALTSTFEIESKSLLESIHSKYGYDFRQYSPKSMNRMLVQAMDRMGYSTLPQLEEGVIQNAECFFDLVQSLTIPVSEMFRDPCYFLTLREHVLPILKTYPSLKMWIAGCSTGEEVYSLAILLLEEGLLDRSTLYATDINARSLQKAEKGIFGLEILPKFIQNYVATGGKRTLTDYYTLSSDSLTFNKNLQDNITFSEHSLATDAVFSEMHLISCRNVLIYFDRALQDRVFSLFHESLCRKGFLGLGVQETLQFSTYMKRFDYFSKKNRIYQKKN